MARPRFEQLPPERQRAILDVAAEEFARAGYRDTSYNQLLDRLELGKSSAYNYFEGKRDLFLTVLRRCYAIFVELLARLPPPKHAADFWPYVHRATVLSYEHVLADPIAANIVRCVQRERELIGEITSADVLTIVDGMYEEAVRMGQAFGVVRTDLPRRLIMEMVRNMGAAFDAWFIAEQAGPNPPSVELVARHFTDAARRLCTPPELLRPEVVPTWSVSRLDRVPPKVGARPRVRSRSRLT